MADRPAGRRTKERIPTHRTFVQVGEDSRVRVQTTFGEVVIDTNRNEGGLIEGEPVLRVRVRGSMFRKVAAKAACFDVGRDHFDAEVRFDA